MPPDGSREYALLEEIVAASAGDLFPGHAVGETAAFRVLSATRSPGPRRRDRAVAVGLEISAAASPELGTALCTALDLDPGDVVRVEGPLRPADLLAPDDPWRGDARSAASTA
jgi:polyphosphate kinase